MARLYEYADSNDKSGYFLWDGSDEGNVTFQVTPLAERLLDRLGFEPGTVNQQRGPRLPNQLQWALYETGLIYTGGSEPPSVADFDGEIEGADEELEIGEEMLAEIESFIRDAGAESPDVRQLADLLNIEADPGAHGPIWNLPESEMAGVEDYLREYLKARLNPDDGPRWTVSVNCTRDTFEEIEKGVVEIRVEHMAEESEKYFHVGYFCPEHGFERISTVSASSVDWNRRKRLEHHRENIIEAVIDMADELDLYVGEPTADIDLLTHDEFDVFE